MQSRHNKERKEMKKITHKYSNKLENFTAVGIEQPDYSSLKLIKIKCNHFRIREKILNTCTRSTLF